LNEDKQKLIDDAVEKALAGDNDVINNIQDRVTRAKAKAALVKAKREQPEKEDLTDDISKSDEKEPPLVNNTVQKVSAILENKFPGDFDGEQNLDWIQLKPKNWFEIAKWLKDDSDFYFDSLQCNTGFDLGDGNLESRYNLHSMKHLHSIEIRIKVSVEKPDIPSVESIWRVADWFERETYDMFGIKSLCPVKLIPNIS
jgi:NADH-quinone oxidoreductase subunit C